MKQPKKPMPFEKSKQDKDKGMKENSPKDKKADKKQAKPVQNNAFPPNVFKAKKKGAK